MTGSNSLCGVIHAPLAVTPSVVPTRTKPLPDDLCNLLQVAASTFHLLDRHLGDDLRPLVRIGLSAIDEVGRYARSGPAISTLYLTVGD